MGGEVSPGSITDLRGLFLAARDSIRWGGSSSHSLVKVKIWEKSPVCSNLGSISVWKSLFEVMKRGEQIRFCSQTIARHWQGFIYDCCYYMLLHSQENKNTISSAFIFNILEMLFLHLFCGVRIKQRQE